jgi:hypothetical protein
LSLNSSWLLACKTATAKYGIVHQIDKAHVAFIERIVTGRCTGLSGKGTLVRCLERIFGQHSFQVSSRDEVIGKFNGHLQDCILFIAIEALPFEVPKLSATAIASMDEKSFAAALDRAIERSKLPASELKKPMSRYRRF